LILARRLTTILPEMTLAEAIGTTRIHRVAGLAGDCTAVVTTCPFLTPDHTISDAGLIGWGHVPMPLDVLQANHAMVFLHRRLEGKRSVVEVLRLPLQDRLLTPERRRAIANASPG
jgi:magnesium chelatase family protein